MANLNQNFVIRFHGLSSNISTFNYVVVVAKHMGKLVWVRKIGSNSWEIPGGHVEEGETPDFAAKRELVEETAAISFEIEAICDFSIETNVAKSYNRLFYAEIREFGEPGSFEIEEVMVSNTVPRNLTHGEIQPLLIDEVFKHVKHK